MTDFMLTVHRTKVPEGRVAVFWMGQAGYLFKTHAGTLIGLDLYLSDCCYRYFGFRRLMPRLVEPADLCLDLLIASHAHYDHFDVDSVPTLLASGKTVFLTAIDGAVECERLGLTGDNIHYLRRGESYTHGDVLVEGLACDHGELAPDALGLLLTIDGKRIYFTGDTAFRADLFRNQQVAGVELLIAPINGAFGNMNAQECVDAVNLIHPAQVLPCHFWNFAEHGGDPGAFAAGMQENAPDIPYTLLPVGGSLLL